MTKSTIIEPTALSAEIAWIEERLAEIDAIPCPATCDWKAWVERDRLVKVKYGELCEALRAHGAQISDGSPLRMRHLGIATSCTEGMHGLLHNWIAAARRRLVPKENAT